ncbi:DMT family transporter [Tumebacillus permanentifrigoris]|uniref:Threonine/homoserine efflux transporter RhtA n=1 Tax=Tumebacillus permanentifrigoris TaxID=378543 RepID=A0A316D782_9BACL|nr:DMT family transporter [Tumebacillus permanentifrigoris]PWK11580.1 threonine/homoserine efflux transporter RhtA [Tumebacillus permanentifrigoris]
MPSIYSLLLLFTSLLWGGNFVVGKLLVGHASSMTLTSLRWIIAAVCLIPLVYWRERKLLPARRALVPLLMMGATGVVLFNLFMFWALERTSATNVGLLSTLNPVSIAVCSFLLLRERLHPLQGLAMLVSLTGVLVVLSGGDLSRLLDLHFNVGDLWMLAAVAMWGLYSVFAKLAMRDVSAMMSTLYAGVFGVLMLLPFNLSNFTIQEPNAVFWWSILYIGLLSTVGAMVFWNIGVQKLGGTAAGMFLNFNPVFTAVLAYFLLGEQLSWIQLAGSALVILGVYAFSRAGRLLLRREAGA